MKYSHLQITIQLCLTGCLLSLLPSVTFSEDRAKPVEITAPAPTAAQRENWHQFLGPQGNSHTETSSKIPLKWSEEDHIKWKTAIHDHGWSSPVVWGKQIWLTTALENGTQMFALCIDRDSGKIIHDIKLFDVEKPSEIHKFNTYASPTPLIEEGRVYISFGSYGLACLDTSTGKVLWQRRDLPCEHFRGPGSSPIMFEDSLILHYDGFDYQYVVALNRKTGDTLWKKDRDIDYENPNGDFKKAYCTPTIIQVNNQLQLISPTSKAVLAYNPRTGEELWRVKYKEFSATVRPIFGHGLVFVNTGFGKASLYAIRPDGSGDISKSHVAWNSAKGIPSKPSHILVGDDLYMIHDQGAALCLDAKTGDQIWQQRVGGNFSATPLYSNGRIYFFSQEGKTTVIKPGKNYEVLAENTLEQGGLASPAVVGNALFLRTKTHLYRIEE